MYAFANFLLTFTFIEYKLGWGINTIGVIPQPNKIPMLTNALALE